MPSDPALRAQIEALVQQAEQSDQAFLAAFRIAEAAIGRAGAVGSDRWLEAQEKLSLAEAARHPAAAALADLHQLAIQHADLPTSQDDIEELQNAMARIDARLAVQQAWLNILIASLPDPAS
ncbi:MAG: hypothetical protein ACT4OE_07805 [Sphingosinicella sp.]